VNPLKKVVQGMRELLATPEKWTQGVEARDAEGRSVSPLMRTHNATCFCLEGAYVRVLNDVYNSADPVVRSAMVISDHLVTFNKFLPEGFVALSFFNDAPTTTHADILAFLDRVEKELT